LSIAIGIDGCKAGWFYFRFDDEAISFGVAKKLADILAYVEGEPCILIDMPIGLLESGKAERQCDLDAREALSPGRASSVFPVPCRQALTASSYEKASQINERKLGRKLSRQSYALIPAHPFVKRIPRSASGGSWAARWNSRNARATASSTACGCSSSSSRPQRK
jgi:predicted RNase H-like nuclease